MKIIIILTGIVLQLVPVLGVECPEYGLKFIRNPRSCNTFYICFGGVASLFKCRRGLYFNEKTGFCDLPQNVNCIIEEKETTPSPTYPIFDCPEEGHHLFPHPSDCSLIIECGNGTLNILSCGPGLHWNPERGYCDTPENANCEDPGLETDPNTTPDREIETTTEEEEEETENPTTQSEGTEITITEENITEVEPEITTLEEDIEYTTDVEVEPESTTIQEENTPDGEMETTTVQGENTPDGDVETTTVEEENTPDEDVETTTVQGENTPNGEVETTTVEEINTPDSEVETTTIEEEEVETCPDEETEFIPTTEQELETETETTLDPLPETTAEPDLQPGDDFCPKEGQHFFPYPYDCGKFIECNNGQKQIQRCIDGLYFDPVKGFCNFPDYVECEVKVPEDPEPDKPGPGPVGECPPVNSNVGYYLPDGADCTIFYQCDWGNPIKHFCPPGLHFNPILNVCDWPWDAGCQAL